MGRADRITDARRDLFGARPNLRQRRSLFRLSDRPAGAGINREQGTVGMSPDLFRRIAFAANTIFWCFALVICEGSYVHNQGMVLVLTRL
jgi:hypothetical protein